MASATIAAATSLKDAPERESVMGARSGGDASPARASSSEHRGHCQSDHQARESADRDELLLHGIAIAGRSGRRRKHLDTGGAGIDGDLIDVERLQALLAQIRGLLVG